MISDGWWVNIWNGIDEEKITKNVSCVIDMVDKSVTILDFKTTCNKLISTCL